MRDILIARLQDDAPTVIEALYENPAAATLVFTGDSKSFIASMSLALSSQAKPKRNIVKLHLHYLAAHFWPVADFSQQTEIFHQILFPFLLFTKPRQKTAEMVWGLVGEHFPTTAASNALSWLDGCDVLVRMEMAKVEQNDTVELMNQVNFSISSKIAGELEAIL